MSPHSAIVTFILHYFLVLMNFIHTSCLKRVTVWPFGHIYSVWHAAKFPLVFVELFPNLTR